jgi:Mor family transcriptional regulator
MSQCYYRGGPCSACVPAHLLEVAEVLAKALATRPPGEPAVLTARHLVLAYARYFGGDSPYVPRGQASERHQRDQAIRAARAAGVPAAKLARTYRLSPSRIYVILG